MKYDECCGEEDDDFLICIKQLEVLLVIFFLNIFKLFILQLIILNNINVPLLNSKDVKRKLRFKRQ